MCIRDRDYSLQRQTNSDMGIEVISDAENCGHKKTTYWAFDQYINFYKEADEESTHKEHGKALQNKYI